MQPVRDTPPSLASAQSLLGARSVPKGSPRWCTAELAGRLVEVSGWRASATYTTAIALVADAQRAGETAVWVGPSSRGFHPPDAHAAGVDLDALPVVRLERAALVPAAADLLARSGGFGVVILDLGTASVSLGVLSRLAGLARTHEAAIVLLTEKSHEHPSLGSVVSLRACASFRRRTGAGDKAEDGDFAHELAVGRDRVRSMDWRQVEVRRGPPGLS